MSGIQYHSLQPLGLHSLYYYYYFFLANEGMSFDNSDSKDWEFIATLFLLITSILGCHFFFGERMVAWL